MVEVTGLHLNHKDTYSVVVMATDESGQCSMTVEDFTVDLTPPTKGNVQIGAFGNEAVMYTNREDILTVIWSDFDDDESDIDSYAVALYDGITCAGNVQQQILQEFIEVSANDTDYTFSDLALKVNQPYYVHLRATNKAGLSTTLVSGPVFVDLKEPVAGLIKDGGDFKVDLDYQSITTVLEGVFLHLPTSEGRSCPSREFSSDSFTADNGWHTVNSQEVWGIGHDDTILFRPSQVVTGNENNDLSITMTRDVTRGIMNSGAIYETNPDVTEGGNTRVVFWDGPAGIVGDYDAPLLRKEWFDDDREYDDCAICCNSNNTLDGDGTCLCNCTEYFDQLRTSTAPPETTRMTTLEAPPTTTVPWEIENEIPPDDTFQGDPNLKLMSHQSMGFQLHPAIEVDGKSNILSQCGSDIRTNQLNLKMFSSSNWISIRQSPGIHT
ncbi:uncharacterized protein [Ptychodera flava]|uniref:uncharacterized protein n=1 Tax=Ptychodera flava TaxID=63121 RepID=UPI00396A6CE6